MRNVLRHKNKEFGLTLTRRQTASLESRFDSYARTRSLTANRIPPEHLITCTFLASAPLQTAIGGR
jgi:hypothetical protein